MMLLEESGVIFHFIDKLWNQVWWNPPCDWIAVLKHMNTLKWRRWWRVGLKIVKREHSSHVRKVVQGVVGKWLCDFPFHWTIVVKIIFCGAIIKLGLDVIYVWFSFLTCMTSNLSCILGPTLPSQDHYRNTSWQCAQVGSSGNNPTGDDKWWPWRFQPRQWGEVG